MEEIKPKIDASWMAVLQEEFKKNYFFELKKFLIEEKKHYNVFPAGNNIFAAYNYTPFDNIKAVIIGQDPYHEKGQANGLCFSVNRDISLPPSLRNIFKELSLDINLPESNNGDLSNWAKEGVLLLNAVLTVREGLANSHKDKGWELFTNATIRAVSDLKKNIVFILWGKCAQEKTYLIDKEKHCILTAAHPSPLSAFCGFFNCKHFSKTNQYLLQHNIQPINWNLNN